MGGSGTPAGSTGACGRLGCDASPISVSFSAAVVSACCVMGGSGTPAGSTSACERFGGEVSLISVSFSAAVVFACCVMGGSGTPGGPTGACGRFVCEVSLISASFSAAVVFTCCVIGSSGAPDGPTGACGRLGCEALPISSLTSLLERGKTLLKWLGSSDCRSVGNWSSTIKVSCCCWKSTVGSVVVSSNSSCAKLSSAPCSSVVSNRAAAGRSACNVDLVLLLRTKPSLSLVCPPLPFPARPSRKSGALVFDELGLSWVIGGLICTARLASTRN